MHLSDYGRFVAMGKVPVFQVALNVLPTSILQACGADPAANWSIYPLPPLNDPLEL